MKCAQTPLKICQVGNVVRLLSTSSYCHKKIRPSLPNLATSDEATKKTELKRRLFGRMFDFIENYGEKVLSNVLPIVAMKAVKMFSRGTKLLFQDMKEFVWINRELSETAHWQVVCRALSRRQLEIYLYLPGELLRVAPVLILSAFPMAQNVVFPLAYMYPHHLLSSHFYSDQQQTDAFYYEAKIRQSYYRSVLRDLILMASKNDPAARKILSSILHEKETPTAAAILNLIPLFSQDGPLHIRKLAAPHVKHLMKIHRVRGSIFWFPRFRLQQYANMIHQIDFALIREGGPEFQRIQDLKKSSHLRGLNVKDLSEESMTAYVNAWLQISCKLDVHNMSLLLHLPILLGYNHASRIWDKKSVF